MASESTVFGAVTLLVIVGSAVLIAGVEAFGNGVVAVGGAIMVVAILLMAWAVMAIDEPEPAGESSH